MPKEARKRPEEARKKRPGRGPEDARRGPEGPGRGQEKAEQARSGPEEARRRPEEASPLGGAAPGECQQKPSGLGFLFYTTTVGGARGAGMHGASRLALPRLRVRVFSPLAKLGPLRAPRGGCRALSEGFGVWGLGFGV